MLEINAYGVLYLDRTPWPLLFTSSNTNNLRLNEAWILYSPGLTYLSRVTDLKCMVPLGAFYLKFLSNFFLKTIWKCLIQDGEEFPCHTVSNVIDLFPSVDCSTSKFPHLVYSYLCYHLTWQVNKIFRLEKKNKASRQPTSIWKFSRVIISVSLSCLSEEDTFRVCYLRTADCSLHLERTESNHTCSRLQILKLFPIDVNRDACWDQRAALS